LWYFRVYFFLREGEAFWADFFAADIFPEKAFAGDFFAADFFMPVAFAGAPLAAAFFASVFFAAEAAEEGAFPPVPPNAASQFTENFLLGADLTIGPDIVGISWGHQKTVLPF
jgi:hypothetical protein